MTFVSAWMNAVKSCDRSSLASVPVLRIIAPTTGFCRL